MKTSTINLTISHEGDLPNGLLAAIEDRVYQHIYARGGKAGDVVATFGSFMPVPDAMRSDSVEGYELVRLPVKEMRDE